MLDHQPKVPVPEVADVSSRRRAGGNRDRFESTSSNKTRGSSFYSTDGEGSSGSSSGSGSDSEDSGDGVGEVVSGDHASRHQDGNSLHADSGNGDHDHSFHEGYLRSCADLDQTPTAMILRNESDLKMQHFSMGSRAFEPVVQGLTSARRSLQSVEISDNRLSDHMLAEMLIALGGHYALARLDLSRNEAGRKTITQITALLSASSSLTDVNLSRMRIGDRELVQGLSGAIDRNFSVTKLNLSHNDIGNCRIPGARRSAVGSLSDALRGNNSIRELDLSWNKLGGVVAAEVATALARNDTMTDLNLRMNSFGIEGATAVAQMLLTNEALTSLDFASNGIEDAGGAALCLAQSLTKNKTLTRLVMDGNSLGRRGGLCFMQAAMDSNTVRTVSLEDCALSVDAETAGMDMNHPSGTHTLDLQQLEHRLVALELLYMPDRTSHVTFKSIVHTGRGGRVTKLDIVLPPARQDSVAAAAGARKDHVVAKYVTSGGETWEVPEEGSLQIVVTTRWRLGTSGQFPGDASLQSMINTMKCHVKLPTTSRAFSFVNLITRVAHLDCARARKIMAYFGPPGAKFGVVMNMDKVRCLCALVERLTDAHNVPTLLKSLLNTSEQKSFFDLLGEYATFTPHNPTGHYDLHLSIPEEHDVAVKLLQIGGTEKAIGQDAEYPDTSQKGNFENFRNECIDDVPIVIDTDTFELPSHGRLTCDYVSTTRPKPEVAVVPAEAFQDLFRKIGLLNEQGEQVLMSEEFVIKAEKQDTENAAQRATAIAALGGLTMLNAQGERVVMSEDAAAAAAIAALGESTATPEVESEAGGATATDSEAANVEVSSEQKDGGDGEAAAGETHELEGLDTAATRAAKVRDRLRENLMNTSTAQKPMMFRYTDRTFGEKIERWCGRTAQTRERVEAALWKLRDVIGFEHLYISTDMLCELLQHFPSQPTGIRVEVAVVLFAHVVDLENYWTTLSNHLTREEQTMLASRLGWLNVWNPLHADQCYWTLELKEHDHRVIADVLMIFSRLEPGENWIGETFEDKAFELTNFWEKNLPNTGTLSLFYTSSPKDGCAPDMPARTEQADRMLLARQRQNLIFNTGFFFGMGDSEDSEDEEDEDEA